MTRVLAFVVRLEVRVTALDALELIARARETHRAEHERAHVRLVVVRVPLVRVGVTTTATTIDA